MTKKFKFLRKDFKKQMITLKMFVGGISFLKRKKHSDIIRMVYEEILCMGFSTRNVENLMKLVLEKLVGFEYDRLPKSTFSKYMLIEAGELAQHQIASELADYEEDLVLPPDGKGKKDHSFTTFDTSKSSAQFYILGLHEVGSGDAEAELHLL